TMLVWVPAGIFLLATRGTRRWACWSSAGEEWLSSAYRTTSFVGQSVRIKNVPFTVIGVASVKGQSAQGQDYDDAVFVPCTTFMAKIQGGLQAYINGQIMVAATSSETVEKAQEDVTDLLHERHHIRQGADDDFNIRNLAEIAAAREEGTNTM